jgi:phospholipid/cholesterol/gamma-HCH transport system substrate-binding protein
LRIRKEIKIGIVFVIALLAFIWGLNYLKGKDIFKNQTILYSVYNNASGINVSDPVLINGYQIGTVINVSIMNDGSGNILVEYSINEDFDIPKNSIAQIESSDLLGSKAIVIKLGYSNSYISSGDTLTAAIQLSLQEEVSLQMLPLKNKAEDLIQSFDSVLVLIQYVFNEKTRANLQNSFESIKHTIKNLEHTTYNVDTLVSANKYRLAGIIDNVESITSNIEQNNDAIQNAIQNFSAISDTLASANLKQTLDNADKTLNDFSLMMERINNGEGSLGLLMQNDSLYRNLEQSSKEVELLIEDMRLNPQRYMHFSIFGKNKKRNEYVAPEED